MKNKQTFLAYCNEMIRLAIPLFNEELQKLGLEEFELGHGIDFPGLPHPVGTSWLSEPYCIFAKTRNPKSGEDEIVQIAICAANGWEPILSVSSTSLDPVRFETNGMAEKDINTIRETLVQCFARMIAN